MFLLKTLFWGALAALAWTHVAYPAAAVAAARLRPRPVRKGDELPSVSVIVAAHDEEAVIERRLENLLELDYPDDKLELAVASDASTDATDELVEREPRVRLIRCPRGGKVAAQNQAVRETSGEIVAFSDANATWAPSALRELVRNFADPDVAYVCGQLRLDDADGTNREGAYWRYELGVRAAESQLHSVTGGNGSIYAVRRSDYVDVDPRFGHDLSFPYLMVQRGRRAVYEPEAVAYREADAEHRRRVPAQGAHVRALLGDRARGRMLRGLGPLYLTEIVSHRHLRYASGLLHLVALGANAALLGEGTLYRALFAGQLAFLGVAALRPGLPRYYVLVTWATVEALAGYLRSGVPAVWEKAAGTR